MAISYNEFDPETDTAPAAWADWGYAERAEYELRENAERKTNAENDRLASLVIGAYLVAVLPAMSGAGSLADRICSWRNAQR